MRYILILVFILVAVTACADNWKQDNTVHGVPVMVWFHLVSYESGFRSDFVNYNRDGTRDYGVMQLNGRYLKYFEEMFNGGRMLRPFIQKDNVRVGCAYLVHLYEYTGSWLGAVWAYNAGPGSWKKGLMPKETERMLAYIFSRLIGGYDAQPIPER